MIPISHLLFFLFHFRFLTIEDGVAERSSCEGLRRGGNQLSVSSQESRILFNDKLRMMSEISTAGVGGGNDASRLIDWIDWIYGFID